MQKKNRNRVTVIGAGLAGCEAAYQIAERGIGVRLIDMKPQIKSEAHKSDDYAELVCSNSFKSENPNSASGILKNELRKLGSIIVSVADETKIPAGQALAVDRTAFSKKISDIVRNHPLITAEGRKIDKVSEVKEESEAVIIATGPLTARELLEDVSELVGSEKLHFFDAAAPLIEKDSIDFSIAFYQSRYDKGGADYINCPFTAEEYELFYNSLVSAELAEVKDFDKVYEGCMPVEEMAARGRDSIRFGMMKPVGLRDPRTGKRPYAAVQLRRDNAAGSLYNMVGFQTRLKFPEQKRVFRMIPGLENAVFARYGVMHKNSFISSPGIIKKNFETKLFPGLYFAGQISGVEGYMESTAAGMAAALDLCLKFGGRKEDLVFPKETIIGGLANYISAADSKNFQPMNANFGLLPPLETAAVKLEKKALLSKRAGYEMDRFIKENGLTKVSK